MQRRKSVLLHRVEVFDDTINGVYGAELHGECQEVGVGKNDFWNQSRWKKMRVDDMFMGSRMRAGIWPMERNFPSLTRQ